MRRAVVTQRKRTECGGVHATSCTVAKPDLRPMLLMVLKLGAVTSWRTTMYLYDVTVVADEGDGAAEGHRVDVEERRAVGGAMTEQHDVARSRQLRGAVPCGGDSEVGDGVEVGAGADRHGHADRRRVDPPRSVGP